MLSRGDENRDIPNSSVSEKWVPADGVALRHLVIWADEKRWLWGSLLGPCLLCKTVKLQTDRNYTMEDHLDIRAPFWKFLYVTSRGPRRSVIEVLPSW